MPFLSLPPPFLARSLPPSLALCLAGVPVCSVVRMGVKERPQCYFDVEINREPGKTRQQPPGDGSLPD